MEMQKYRIDIVGKTALLMHADSVEGSDITRKWQKSPENKKLSVAGDDRSPGWAWVNYLYYDDCEAESKAVIAIPQENIMRFMMEGGAMISAGKGAKTLKSNVMSGMQCTQAYSPLLVSGKEVKIAPFLKMMRQNVTDFEQHMKAANDAGFSLYVKRARVGASKHVRVRPRFNNWGFSFDVIVWDELITEQVINQIATYSGRYKGLCDWRPGSPTPGSYGTFEATVTKIA